LFANSTIIPLKLQQEVIIGGGQPKTIQPIYVGFAGATEEVILSSVDDQVLSGKFANTYSTKRHFKTPGNVGTLPGANF